MSIADIFFNKLVGEILDFGVWAAPEDVRTKWDDGTPAHFKSVLNRQWVFDGNGEVPILTTKKVAWKTAIKELLWIWQLKSNRLEDLRAMGVKIWDKWEIKEGEWAGTIGPAYGYQLAKKCRQVGNEKLDQVDYMLHALKTSPGSRRIVTSLWGVEDLDEMGIEPCVWNTQWIRKEDLLNLTVGIRSNDICVGNPFNVFQYYILMRMVCQVTGMKPGALTFNIMDAHVYDRHMDNAAKQITLETHAAPDIWINPDIKDFYDFTVDDFNLIDYVSNDTLQYELAE